jgi:hypothetical protein
MTLHETELYNFNINYNPELNAVNLWINAPVFDDEHRPIGMVGSGIELSRFTETIYKGVDDLYELYFFNAFGEITGARDVRLVEEKVKIEGVIGAFDEELFAFAKNLSPGEIRIVDIPL